MQEMPRILDETTFMGMVRYSLATGMDRLVLRPGFRPMVDGLGGPRELGWRQVTCEDTDAAAGIVLERMRVPKRMRNSELDAARELFPLFELPGEALIEAEFEAARGGIAVSLDLIRPLEQPAEIEAPEPGSGC